MKDFFQKNKIFKPRDLISVLKKHERIKQAYEQKVRHYVLEDHTVLVMNVFEKYYSNVDLPIERNLFRTILALHDIGKPKADKEGNRSNQYKYTLEVISNINDELPFTKSEIQICNALLSGDSLGMYMQSKINLTVCKNEIFRLAKLANMNASDFFKLAVIYYQCDIASYTADAGGLAYLEHLFEYKEGNKVFDDKKKIIKFSRNFEAKYLELEREIRK